VIQKGIVNIRKLVAAFRQAWAGSQPRAKGGGQARRNPWPKCPSCFPAVSPQYSCPSTST
jgi:hypothetical protein